MLVLCSGSSCELVAGGLTVSSGRDYYAAASVDLDGLTTTLYLQDLTGAGPLQSASVGHTYSSLNSPAGFGIGALANGDLSFDGLIDEVRISNHARSESELLVNAPETFVPAVGPLGLVAIGSALALVGVLAHRRTDTPRRATGAAG